MMKKHLLRPKKKKKLDRQMRLTGRADTGFHEVVVVNFQSTDQLLRPKLLT